MKIMNFGHELSLEAVKSLQNLFPEHIIEIYRSNISLPFAEGESAIEKAIIRAFDNIMRGINQKNSILITDPTRVILPGNATAAALVVAEYTGRFGFLPRIITFSRRPTQENWLPDFACDLQKFRTEARTRR